MNDLTLLVLTKNTRYAQPFLRAAFAKSFAYGLEYKKWTDGVDIDAHGHIEAVLDDLVNRCDTEYVLRLDDDETLTAEAWQWITDGGYREHDHWAFQRANLWPDAEHRIDNPPLWPDLQTRLSTKAKSGGRTKVHVGSPYGTGHVAPGVILHHKFLVRPRAEREALMARYEQIEPGAGNGWAMFSVPELYEKDLKCVPVS